MRSLAAAAPRRHRPTTPIGKDQIFGTDEPSLTQRRVVDEPAPLEGREPPRIGAPHDEIGLVHLGAMDHRAVASAVDDEQVVDQVGILEGRPDDRVVPLRREIRDDADIEVCRGSAQTESASDPVT